MAVRLQIRNDTAANWTAANPVLATGELAIETDTRKFKIGNGSQTWNSLLYATQGEEGPQGISLEFNWSGTQLGIRKVGDASYIYVDLIGDKGDPFVYADFSQEQLDALQGPEGPAGDVWKPTVSSAGLLSWTKDSGATAPTQRNIKGDTGDTWKPSVSVNGDLSWTKDSGATAPTPVNIKGDEGPPGEVSLTQLNNLAGSGRTTETVKNNADTIALKLSKSGDTLDTYTEKLVSGTNTLNLNNSNTFAHSPTVDTSYAITNAKAGAHSFTLVITMGATAKVLSFPASVKWQSGDIPDMSETNKTYVLTFLTVDSGSNWLGMYGGEF